jgi:hypothetical protein
MWEGDIAMHANVGFAMHKKFQSRDLGDVVLGGNI